MIYHDELIIINALSLLNHVQVSFVSVIFTQNFALVSVRWMQKNAYKMEEMLPSGGFVIINVTAKIVQPDLVSFGGMKQNALSNHRITWKKAIL